jgi:hypothetical protein
MHRVQSFLDKYQDLYNTCSEPLQFPLMKLALLETAAWIEVVFDELYVYCGKSPQAREEIDRHIKKVHSFGWEHLRKTLIFCLGINVVCALENKYAGEKLTRFKSMLGNIKSVRDELAHNYQNTTKQIISFEDLRKDVRAVHLAVLLVKRHIK